MYAPRSNLNPLSHPLNPWTKIFPRFSPKAGWASAWTWVFMGVFEDIEDIEGFFWFWSRMTFFEEILIWVRSVLIYNKRFKKEIFQPVLWDAVSSSHKLRPSWTVRKLERPSTFEFQDRLFLKIIHCDCFWAVNIFVRPSAFIFCETSWISLGPPTYDRPLYPSSNSPTYGIIWHKVYCHI